MNDRLNEGIEEIEAGAPVQTDETPALVAEETNSEIELQKHELDILIQQVKAIYNDTRAAETLRPIEDDEKLAHCLQYPERIFVESNCRLSHVFVPRNGKYASVQELAVFYHKAPVSPVLFQDSLIENVFGITFEHKQNTEEGLRERQQYFIKLRLLFSQLTSLPHQRRYERARNKIKRIFVIPLTEAKGKILVTRKASDRRINSVYDDIYSAQRAHSHILNQYDGTVSDREVEGKGEFKALLGLTEKLQLLIGFIQRWKSASGTERIKMAQILEEAADLLKNSENRLKLSALGRAESSAEFVDSRGRVNPCATAPKILAMAKDLFARLDEVLSIRSKISLDKQTLETILSQLHVVFYQGSLELGSLLKDDFFQPIDTEDIKSSSNVKYKCVGINRKLDNVNGIVARLERMKDDKHTPAPFVQYAEAVVSNYQAVEMLNEFIEKTRNGMTPYTLKQIHDELCKYAITGYVVMKYQFIHRTYHEILTGILEQPEQVDYDEERRKLNALSLKLRPHEFQREFDLRDDLKIDLPGLRGLFEHIQLVISKISEHKRARIELQSELLPLELKAESGESTQEEADRIVELKTLLTQQTIDFRNEVREVMKDFDFIELANEANVQDPLAEVEAFISQLS